MCDGGIWVEALIGKNTGVLQEKLGSMIIAGQSNEEFFDLVWGRRV